MKINKKEGILIIIVLFVITFAAYYVYFLMPTLEEIDNLRVSIEQKRIQSASMQAQIAQIGSLREQIEEIEVQIDRNTENIPRGVNEALQLVAITNIINDADQLFPKEDQSVEMTDYLVITYNNSYDSYGTYQNNYVDINFSTNYERLKSVLEKFSELNMENQIVSMSLLYNTDATAYYVQNKNNLYMNAGLTIEFYTFMRSRNQEAPEKQDFEQELPADGKNPFMP